MEGKKLRFDHVPVYLGVTLDRSLTFARQNLGAIENVREPLWSCIRNHCSSFSAMTAGAVFSEIFTIRALGDLSYDLKSVSYSAM